MQRSRGRFRIVAGATDMLPWVRAGRAGDVEIPLLIDVTAFRICANCAWTSAGCGSAQRRRFSVFSTIRHSLARFNLLSDLRPLAIR